MPKILDTYGADTLADALMEVIDDLGFPANEAIPGLIATIARLARTLPDSSAALDEAAELLGDA